MRKFIFTLLMSLCLFGFTDQVYALSGRLTVTSNVNSAAINTKFNVYVKYTGDTVGTIRINTTFTNATCTLYSQADGYTRNCSSTGCKIKFEDYEKGYKSGTTLATFACTGTSSPAKFTASVIDGDAWDLEGLEAVSVSGGSKNVTITNATTKATTTTKKTTTKKKTTTSKKTTTKGSTTTKVTTTTKATTTTKPTTTTTTTTKSSTTKKTATTEPITTNIAHINDDMKLESLKVVGYDIDFKKNLTGYKIYVADSVDEVYVIAESIDKSKKVVNTGVINIEGLSHFSVMVYNEKTDQTVSYTVKVMREKSSLAEVLYDKFYKPSVALAAIILTLIILGISLYKSGTFVKIEKLPKIDNDDVTYDGTKFLSKSEVKISDVKDDDDDDLDTLLGDIGIEELNDSDEEQLTKVLLDMNKKD